MPGTAHNDRHSIRADQVAQVSRQTWSALAIATILRQLTNVQKGSGRDMDEAGATLQIGEKSLELEKLTANEGNNGYSIESLRASTGSVVYDPGFANTASSRSSITYVDGSAGKLTHRGYAIEDLANSCSFLEVAYLLPIRPSPQQG